MPAPGWPTVALGRGAIQATNSIFRLVFFFFVHPSAEGASRESARLLNAASEDLLRSITPQAGLQLHRREGRAGDEQVSKDLDRLFRMRIPGLKRKQFPSRLGALQGFP